MAVVRYMQCQLFKLHPISLYSVVLFAAADDDNVEK